jgi:hypothetical protein
MKAEIKERPMLFSAPMVRAILDGSKTQTRRIMKPQPEPCEHRGGHSWPSNNHQSMLHIEDEMQKWTGLAGDACPYGDIGERIWVRETFCKVDYSGYGDPAEVWVDYRATPKYKASHPAGWDNDPHNEDALKWKPSIHMPRWASRINLEITAVRVERLNDISEADACAEGIECEPCDQTVCFKNYMAEYWIPAWGDTIDTAAILSFESLWESINGAGSWQENPWVWVIEFKRV